MRTHPTVSFPFAIETEFSMMKQLLNWIAPPHPPMSPMNFSRMPVVHLFWAGGLVGAVAGFALGFALWMWLQGILAIPEAYALMKLWHGRLQILLFAGSFLLGFGLQSGPHVIGGTPPPSSRLLWLLRALWMGFLLTLLPMAGADIVGNALISGAYGGAAWFLADITRGGDPKRRFSRGYPMTAAFLFLAAAPWLPLDDADAALFILWCGPISAAMVAGQQLIHNVLGGRLLTGTAGHLFAGLITLAWILSGLAAFGTLVPWSLAAAVWLAATLVMVQGTGFVPAVAKSGFTAINVTLVLGFSAIVACEGLMLGLAGAWPVDAAVHLLGAGVLTILILGVVARVVAFFSAGPIFPSDRLVVWLVMIWAGVAVVRTLSPMGGVDDDAILVSVVVGGLVMALWSVRVGYRLTRILEHVPEAIKKGG